MISSKIKFIVIAIIAGLTIIVYGMFTHYQKTISKLEKEITTLEVKKSEVENSYETLKNLHEISLTQIEELRKNEKASLEDIANYERIINDMQFGIKRDENSIKLLKDINDFEKCWAKNYADPSVRCKLGDM